MSTTTTNYGLKKPTASEYFNVEDQNGNMDLIDAQLKNLNDNKESLFKNVTTKPSLVDEDTIPLTDSTASGATKKIIFSNLKTVLKTYFDSQYNKYIHPTYTARSAGLYKVTVDGTGHVSAATSVAKTDITALGIPAQDTVTEVIDNLTSTDSTKALSAKQGKALNDLVSNLSDNVNNLDASQIGLPASTAALYGAENVDDALKSAIILSSYFAFVGAVNANQINAAFGQNNENIVKFLGLQLAMYAWWKGDSKITYPFTNLKNKQTLADIANDRAAVDELYANANLRALIETSTYACGVMATYTMAVDRSIANANMLAFINASTNLKTAYQTGNNGVASAKMAAQATGLDYTAIVDFNAFLDNTTWYNALIASTTGMAWIYCNERNNMKLIAKQVGQVYSTITGTASFIASSAHLTALKSSALGLKSLVMSTNTKVLTDMHAPLNADQASRTAVLTTLRTANAYFNAETSVNSPSPVPSFAIPYQAARSSGTGSSTASWSDSYGGGSWSMGISGTSTFTATADIYLFFKNCNGSIDMYGSFTSVKYISPKAGVI